MWLVLPIAVSAHFPHNLVHSLRVQSSLCYYLNIFFTFDHLRKCTLEVWFSLWIELNLRCTCMCSPTVYSRIAVSKVYRNTDTFRFTSKAPLRLRGGREASEKALFVQVNFESLSASACNGEDRPPPRHTCVVGGLPNFSCPLPSPALQQPHGLAGGGGPEPCGAEDCSVSLALVGGGGGGGRCASCASDRLR